jgi:hypothetical protein
LAHDYKAQRDALRSANEDHLSKINERNLSIEKIESEVETLKNHFKNKESLLKRNYEIEIDNINRFNEVSLRLMFRIVN